MFSATTGPSDARSGLTARRAASERRRPVVPAALDANQLVRRLEKRDVEAFEALYEDYHRMVFGIGLRLLGDPASTEDLVQSVFLKVWTNPAAFKGGSLVAWLGRVTRNAGLDVLRKRSAHPETEIAAEMPLDDMFEDAVVADSEAQRVRSALLRLPASERVAIEMGFFRGMTYLRVATETGVPLGTVKTRIRTGLHRLRRALQIPTGQAC
jgi:RNA polymerase sigma-70 factor (ECF subfamily)